MSNITYHSVVMFTMFILYIYLITSSMGASIPDQEPTMLEIIKRHQCIFPPKNVKIETCEKYSLTSEEIKDLKDNVEFYLCAALVDSTTRLCSIVAKNKQFGERVKKDLEETLSSLMAVSDDVCTEMNVLDLNTTVAPAKYVYQEMKKVLPCPSVCSSLEDSESSLRQSLCKSIKFAHREIRLAEDLRKTLNEQAQKPLQEESAVKPKPQNGAVSQSNPSEIQPPGEPQGSLSGKVEESHVAQTAASRNRTMDKTAGVLEGAPDPVVKSDPDSTKSEKIPEPPVALESPSNDAVAAVPPETSGNQKTSNIEQLKTGFENQEEVKTVAKAQDVEKKKKNPVTDVDTPAEEPDRIPGPPQEEEDGVGAGNQGDLAKEPLLDDNLADEQSPYLTDNKTPNEDDEGTGIAEVERPTEKKYFYTNSPSSQNSASNSQKYTGKLAKYDESDDSHFFAYFMSLSALCVLAYLVYHNKRKIIAMAVEGKKGRNTSRRRPNSASYHKLDSNLEEAMSSNSATTNSYVIY